MAKRISAVHIHGAIAVLWGILLVPTMLLWRDSLVWVVFMSWYANFVGEITAYQAAHAERDTVSNDQHEVTLAKLAEVEAKLDRLLAA